MWAMKDLYFAKQDNSDARAFAFGDFGARFDL
jgi:hypothetical protein